VKAVLGAGDSVGELFPERFLAKSTGANELASNFIMEDSLVDRSFPLERRRLTKGPLTWAACWTEKASAWEARRATMQETANSIIVAKCFLSVLSRPDFVIVKVVGAKMTSILRSLALMLFFQADFNGFSFLDEPDQAMFIEDMPANQFLSKTKQHPRPQESTTDRPPEAVKHCILICPVTWMNIIIQAAIALRTLWNESNKRYHVKRAFLIIL
jgi:hypothetical protein